MILVYTPHITSRTEYITSLLFNYILGVPHKLTRDEDSFTAYNGPKINYSPRAFHRGGIHISYSGFLQERGVRPFEPPISKKKRIPLIFPSKEQPGALGFDPFAASFYLVSRYEEYLPHKKDKHLRFEADQSYAFRHGFLQKPVVNHYALMIKQQIEEKYPGYQMPPKSFTFVPTYDVDVAFAYKGRTMFRNFFGILRSLSRLDFRSLKQRFRVILGREKDPYDTYDMQLQLCKNHDIRAYYFFLCGDYGPYDKNVAFFSRQFFLLIKKLGDYAYIGIHPSYASNEEEGALENELRRLAGILKDEIKYSRQHYLRLHIPKTYRDLLKHNISYDFTMGYASQPGFRAGTCSPFLFYDLELEKETPLTLVPLALMDGTLNDYLGLTPEEGLKTIKKLIAEVEEAGGTFSTLWHNDALGDTGTWKGWREVYRKTFEAAAKIHHAAR